MADDWVNAHLLRGKHRRAEGHYAEALADLRAAGQIPDNLPSDQASDNAHAAEIAYATGLVHEAMGEQEKAHQAWEQAAATGRGEPRRGGYGGGSRRSHTRYIQALALRKLGRRGDAEPIFRELAETAHQTLQHPPAIDTTAAATIQQSQRERLAQAHFTAGLGALGLGRLDEARRQLAECLKICPDHLGAKTQMEDLAVSK